MGQGRAWLLLAATVALTCLVTLAVPVRAKTGRELLLSGVDGLLMEVPMRWATLPCLWALLSWREMTAAGPIAVVVTAAVWCVGIVVQAVVTRTLRPRSLVIELLSSCLFSLGVGAVVLQTECILFPMAGHFAERILGYFLRRRFGKTVE